MFRLTLRTLDPKVIFPEQCGTRLAQDGTRRGSRA